MLESWKLHINRLRFEASEINWKDIWGKYHTTSIEEYHRYKKLESRYIKIKEIQNAIHSRR